MQLARNLCLRRDKSWKRKIEEAMITVHLEHNLSKKQIFERYCNLVYLGGDGAFGINGDRRGGAGLFQQRRAQAKSAGSRDHRGADSAPDLFQSLPLSRPRVGIAATWC